MSLIYDFYEVYEFNRNAYDFFEVKELYRNAYDFFDLLLDQITTRSNYAVCQRV